MRKPRRRVGSGRIFSSDPWIRSWAKDRSRRARPRPAASPARFPSGPIRRRRRAPRASQRPSCGSPMEFEVPTSPPAARFRPQRRDCHRGRQDGRRREPGLMVGGAPGSRAESAMIASRFRHGARRSTIQRRLSLPMSTRAHAGKAAPSTCSRVRRKETGSKRVRMASLASCRNRTEPPRDRSAGSPSTTAHGAVPNDRGWDFREFSSLGTAIRGKARYLKFRKRTSPVPAASSAGRRLRNLSATL